jgi:hypothetical protein
MLILVFTLVWLETRKPVNARVALVAPNWVDAPPSTKLIPVTLNGVLGRRY